MADAAAQDGSEPAGGPADDGSRRTQQLQTAAALGLLQRLPPKHLHRNLQTFKEIAPHLERSLEPYVTDELKLKLDPDRNMYFIASSFNCEGETHRSPWSNKYVPAPPGGDAEEDKLFRPLERLRGLELAFNEVFDAYTTAYYEGGVSSVYLWDMDEGFAGVFLIRKEVPQSVRHEKGLWESIHIMEVREAASTKLIEYKLNSTVRLNLEAGDMAHGQIDLSTIISRQVEGKAHGGKRNLSDEGHIATIGKMIEEMENNIRLSIHTQYVAKSMDVLQHVRTIDDFGASRA